MCMKMKMDSSVVGRSLSKQAHHPAVFAGLYTCIRCGRISKTEKLCKICVSVQITLDIHIFVVLICLLLASIVSCVL